MKLFPSVWCMKYEPVALESKIKKIENICLLLLETNHTLIKNQVNFMLHIEQQPKIINQFQSKY